MVKTGLPFALTEGTALRRAVPSVSANGNPVFTIAFPPDLVAEPASLGTC